MRVKAIWDSVQTGKVMVSSARVTFSETTRFTSGIF